VRDMTSEKAIALRDRGVTLMPGVMDDTASVKTAMAGVHGVFSVQPSSGQGAAYNVTDEAEIRWGKAIADAASASGVQHLVYSSVNAAGTAPTGMGHFDSKAAIEAHIRSLPLQHTIIRPSGFMELLMLPGMGLDQDRLNFLMRPDQTIQSIAASDIGRITAGIFADPDKFAGQTIEIAGDALTGTQIADKLSRAAGRPITYHRLPDSVLAPGSFLGRLADLIDDGRLAGNADIDQLRQDFPGLLTMDAWLAGAGKPLLTAALQTEGGTLALR
jgi:uncharacterized protein YbjT (DUF2867 family)